MRYILSAGDRGVSLRPGTSRVVSIWIDAAYGIHADGNSHTGSVFTFGDSGPVYAKSSEQKNVTKSSTEAELVEVSDATNQELHIRYLVQDRDYYTGPPEYYGSYRPQAFKQ